MRTSLSRVLPWARRAAIYWLGAALLGGCHASPGEPQSDILVPPAVMEDEDPNVLVPPSEPSTFLVPTYESSGELVHPDAFVSPRGWHGNRYWFAATPYPSGNASFENPSIFTSRRTRDWQPPAGLRNPLARPDSGGYLSDPDIVLDPVRDELRVYYRQTIRDVDQLFLKTSVDGVAWSAPVPVLEDARHELISPAIVREEDGSWRMWTVGARKGGCSARSANVVLSSRLSPDGIAWGQPKRVTLAIPGRVPWHWDVQYIPAKAEYWALVAAYPDGRSCSETAVFFARSADGLTWTVSPTPLLAPGALEALRDVVYRSTFRYWPTHDQVVVWFSGARLQGGSYHFAVASARYALPDLLRRVQRSVSPIPSPMLSVAEDQRTSADTAARRAFIRHFP
jgi:hypothetical protein